MKRMNHYYSAIKSIFLYFGQFFIKIDFDKILDNIDKHSAQPMNLLKDYTR